MKHRKTLVLATLSSALVMSGVSVATAQDDETSTETTVESDSDSSDDDSDDELDDFISPPINPLPSFYNINRQDDNVMASDVAPPVNPLPPRSVYMQDLQADEDTRTPVSPESSKKKNKQNTSSESRKSKNKKKTRTHSAKKKRSTEKTSRGNGSNPAMRGVEESKPDRTNRKSHKETTRKASPRVKTTPKTTRKPVRKTRKNVEDYRATKRPDDGKPKTYGRSIVPGR